MKGEYEEIDLKAALEQRFAAGQGVVALPAEWLSRACSESPPAANDE